MAGATRAPDLCGVGAEMHVFLLASQGSGFVGMFFCHQWLQLALRIGDKDLHLKRPAGGPTTLKLRGNQGIHPCVQPCSIPAPGILLRQTVQGSVSAGCCLRAQASTTRAPSGSAPALALQRAFRGLSGPSPTCVRQELPSLVLSLPPIAAPRDSKACAASGIIKYCN